MVSNKHMYVQFIDDERQHTLACASTHSFEHSGPNITKAQELGKVAAQNAKEAGIERVVVDRGGFRYHGRVKAIIEAAAEHGIRIGRTVTQSLEAAQNGEQSDTRVDDSAVGRAEGEDGSPERADKWSNESIETAGEPSTGATVVPSEEEKT